MTQREREKRRVSCACVCLVQRKIPASALINNLFFAGEHVQSASVRRAKQTSIRRNLHESLALSNSAEARDEERRRIARIRVASLIVMGVLFYTFSERTSTASNSAAVTTTGRGVAGPSGKGT